MIETNPTFLGVDLSLTGTGLVVVDGSGVLLHMSEIGTKPHSHVHILSRSDHIAQLVLKTALEYKPKLVAIESLFCGPRASSVLSLGTLHALCKYQLLRNGFRLASVSPSSLKKFLGSGKLQKSQILKAVYKEYGVDCDTDNKSDAYTLSRLAQLLDSALNSVQLGTIPKYKSEVIAKLSKDRENVLMEGGL